MSTNPATSPRRALAGLPPRGGRSSAGVARLIRSNRADETDAAETPSAEVPASRPPPAATEPESPRAREPESI